MAAIQVLDKYTAELIAAGEVVERPASVVKELVENSIDAGATTVTVEIRNGGCSLIRVEDNGCGIAREDVPVAFLRHATSKVRTADDLDSISTLGFRGEALASVAAVSRVEITTRTADEMAGTRYLIDGGDQQGIDDIGRPQGTTIFVRDLFYNVPARMKFLKKDVSEGNAVASAMDCIALSHPEVSIRLIRDGKEVLHTPGDGQALSCIYTVFGSAFAQDTIPVDYTLGGVHVHGYIGKPSTARSSRSMQQFFINGRYVKTRTAMAALEQAYKGSLMVGKFPAAVLYIDLPPETVDANVHPAKIEVRFINEKPVFDAIYHGVRSALEKGDTPLQATLPKRVVSEPVVSEQTHFRMPTVTARETAKTVAATPIKTEVTPATSPQKPISTGRTEPVLESKPTPETTPFTRLPSAVPGRLAMHDSMPLLDALDRQEAKKLQPKPAEASAESSKTEEKSAPFEEVSIRYIGEAFCTYLVAERGDSLYVIDKHAAHEYILYRQLRENARRDAQWLLEPVTAALSREEYDVLLPELERLREAGFEVEDFGGTLLVRALPMMLTGEDVSALLQEIAGGFLSGKREISMDKLDWIYHSVACRAAIKAGNRNSPEEMAAFAERVLSDSSIRYCPHGRPVCFELTRRELEKQFGRIV